MLVPDSQPLNSTIFDTKCLLAAVGRCVSLTSLPYPLYHLPYLTNSTRALWEMSKRCASKSTLLPLIFPHIGIAAAMGCGSSVPKVTVGVSTSVLFSVWRRRHGRAFAIECSIDSFYIFTLST